MSKQIFYLLFLKVFYYFLFQKPFWPFLENKKILNKLLFHKVCGIVLWYIKKVCASFHKILIFNVPVIFQKWKLCCACAVHLWGRTGFLFWIWTHKNTHHRGPSVSFKIRNKILNHSTLIYMSLLIRLAVPLPSTQKRVGGILPGYDAIWNKNQPHTILTYLLPHM